MAVRNTRQGVAASSVDGGIGSQTFFSRRQVQLAVRIKIDCVCPSSVIYHKKLAVGRKKKAMRLFAIVIILAKFALLPPAVRGFRPTLMKRYGTSKALKSSDSNEDLLVIKKVEVVEKGLTKIKPNDGALESGRAFFLLNLCAIIWGSQHVVIKSSLEGGGFPTSALNFWRFLSAAVVFSPAFLNVLTDKRKTSTSRVLRGGVELGVYTFLGFAFQSIGLETTTASKSAFLLYLNVKFVPFLTYLLYGRKVAAQVWISAGLALSGTYLLSTDGLTNNFVIGDAWCIAAAVASAMFILRLETISRQEINAAELNGVCAVTVAVLCSLWVGLDFLSGINGDETWNETFVAPLLSNPWAPLYLGAVTTSLCGWLQTLGQRVIPAERASIIYSLDPLYGAAFSSYFLQEHFGQRGVIGALCILLGVAVTSLNKHKERDQPCSNP